MDGKKKGYTTGMLFSPVYDFSEETEAWCFPKAYGKISESQLVAWEIKPKQPKFFDNPS